MDLKSVLISTLLLMAAESNQTTLGSNSSESPFSTQTNNPSVAPSSAAGHTSKSGSSAILLGLITIKWIKQCEGKFNLILYPHTNSSPVCHSSERNTQSLFGNVCENQKGCKDTLLWLKGGYTMEGYDITERGATTRTGRCEILKFRCTVELLPDVQGHLQAYKVVTALLCCILLVLLLVRFTRPTVKALQKRLSERRQNRWIGPTQSHSVSYNRGKTAVKINDGEKRLSYPALERLAVSDSREPSSNRNSDYNF